MGASLVIREHGWASREDITRWVSELTSQDRYENGSSYSGYWNMNDSGVQFNESKVYASTDEAHEFISDHHEKGRCVMAVPALRRLALSREVHQADAKSQGLKQQLEAATTQVWQFNRTVLHRAKESKSAYKGCTHCGSRVSVKHLTETRCPVCKNNLLRTETDDKREAALKARVQAITAKLDARHLELLKKTTKGKPVEAKVWVVGGWCAEQAVTQFLHKPPPSGRGLFSCYRSIVRFPKEERSYPFWERVHAHFAHSHRQ